MMEIERIIGTLTQGFGDFCEVAHIRSSSGRVMLGCECFVMFVLLVAFSLMLVHELLAAVVSAFVPLEVEFEAVTLFKILGVCAVCSVLLVLVRELLDLRP